LFFFLNFKIIFPILKHLLINPSDTTAPTTINITDYLVIGWPGVVVEQEFQLKKGLAATIYTDYDTIAARYSCNIVDGQKQEYFYIMVRNRGFNDVSKLFNVLELLKKLPSVNLNKMQFDLVNDLSCTN
jgi:hypothetical protein